ncbi:fimbria/pilus outer membrane usher protein [Rickettsiella endosymbiont of Dermanyssus gallinae]|uniref:fimbria/pilus outer membrane usher protein n=1 Tax=Rickettsiella endosymbiont of Dermanyssus gallinae TaxID=2856608 RepID=UPI001C5298BF|nr:fimbria/pilus outer membrane usher protein [Rickettsiella endosymbiont of Dermanyssus gallinae]
MDKAKNQFYICFKYSLVVCFIIFCLLNSIATEAKQRTGFLATSPVTEKEKFYLIPLLLEIKLNESLLSEVTQAYKDSLGHVWVDGSAFRRWRMHLPHHRPVLYEGRKLYQLNWYPGLTYRLDQYAMQLSLQVPATLFTGQTFDPLSKRLGALRPKDPGAFLNYDMVGLRNNSPEINQTNLSALMGLGLFNRLGVGTADVLAYNKYANDITLLTNQSNKLVRLNTTWTLDEPEKIARWRFGDAITGSTYWSGAARFAGVQYATNFNTQPNLVTFPLPGYEGEAAIPSTVDVFVNSVLNQQQIVNNGPYIFNNIPVISGAGTVNIVTQDLLGRSQVVSFPYYASPLLLKPNLVNFSYEVGFIRDNYGVDSNGYGRFLGVATYQRGITDHLTLGGHAEVLFDQQTLGFSADYLLNQYGVASLAVAGGHNSLGEGGLLALGFVHQGTQFSYGFNTSLTSLNYLQLGDQPNTSPPSVINQLFLGYSLADYGSLSTSYTMINSRNFNTANGFSNTPTARLLTASYSHNLFKNISLTVGFVGDLRNSQTNQAFLTLVFAPDINHTISNSSNWQNHQFQDALQFSKPVPLGKGYGYNLFASNNSSRYAGVDMTMQNEIGAYTARLGQGRGLASYELDASGSVIYFAGNGFLARKLTNSFALVQVPDFPGVDVFYENQLMGHTDKAGNLLITQLLPYQENSIAIEPTTLPLDAQIGMTTQTAIPYFSSGVLVKFPVKHMQGAVMHLLTPSGKFVPVGAELVLNTDHACMTYPVGYDGEVYIPDISDSTLIGSVHWDKHDYYFSVNLPQTDDPIIELGEVPCY